MSATGGAGGKSPRGLTRDARADWVALATRSPDPEAFNPGLVDHLPEPAQRWLRHAIAPGTPLCTAAEVRTHGEIRLGTWRRFSALQRLTPTGGFVWAATAQLFRLPVIGFDRYTRGTGQMRWRLLNAVPVMRADGPDVTRSAAGRHAGELLLYMPAVAITEAADWRAVDENRVIADLVVGSTRFGVTINVARTGALAELVLSRWGNPGGDPFAEHSFGATFRDEVTFSGVALPREVVAGWHYGSARWPEGQFIRYFIDDVAYS